MIIQMDAGTFASADDWGQSAVLRRRGRNPPAGIGFTSAPAFRLDHRGQSAGGRPRHQRACGFVATRAGVDGLQRATARRSLAAAAWGQGSRRAGSSADGAVDLAMGRRPLSASAPAVGLLPCRVREHLAAVGRTPLWRGIQAKLKSLAQAAGQTIEKRIRHQSHRPTGGGAGAIAGWSALPKRCKGKLIISMSMRPDGLPRGHSDAANPLAAARWKPPAGAEPVRAASNVPEQFWSQTGR